MRIVRWKNHHFDVVAITAAILILSYHPVSTLSAESSSASSFKTTSTTTFVCENDVDCSFPNGICNVDDQLQCKCERGYTGLRCDKPCPLMCQNGGICQVLDPDTDDDSDTDAGTVEFSCDCPPSHNGALCEDPNLIICEDDDNCSYPNGRCDTTDSNNRNKCICNSGYWGESCKESCPVKCQNGGQCAVRDDHGGLEEFMEFYCVCPAEYRGSVCQTLKQTTTTDSSGEATASTTATTESSSSASPPSTPTDNSYQQTSISRSVPFILVLTGGIVVILLFSVRKARNMSMNRRRSNHTQDGVVVVGKEVSNDDTIRPTTVDDPTNHDEEQMNDNMIKNVELPEVA